MSVVLAIVFVLACFASYRSSAVYERESVMGRRAARMKHLELMGVIYFSVAILAGFMIAGTIEAASL